MSQRHRDCELLLRPSDDACLFRELPDSVSQPTATVDVSCYHFLLLLLPYDLFIFIATTAPQIRTHTAETKVLFSRAVPFHIAMDDHSPPVQHNLTTEQRWEFVGTPPAGRKMLCMGFYPTQPMWIGKKLVPLPADTAGTPELAVAMHQSIGRYCSNLHYEWFITRDGMIIIGLTLQLLQKADIGSDVEADYRRIAANPMYAGMSQTTWGRKWSLYVDYMNAIHLLVAAARQDFLQSLRVPQYISEVTVTNAVVFQFYVDDPLHRSMPLLCQFTWNPLDGSEEIVKDPTLRCPVMRITRDNCPVMPPEENSLLLDRVDQQLASCDLQRVRLLAMVARAIHAYQETSYDTCLILLWTVIENLISKRYDDFTAEQAAVLQPSAIQPPPATKSGKKYKKKRQQRKQNIDISSQIRTLHQNNKLPRGRPSRDIPPKGRFMEFIELVRRVRNEFVHSTKPCNDEHCQKAYTVVEDLVRVDWSITLPCMQSRPMVNIATSR